MHVFSSVVFEGVTNEGMLALCDFDHLGGDRIHTLHEEKIHTIENDLHNVLRPPDSTNFSDICLFNGLYGFLSLSEIRKSLLKLTIGLISFDLNGCTLLFASLSDTIDFFSLNVGFLVLFIELFEELVGGLSSSIELGILFLEDNLHGLDILRGLSEFEQSLVNVLFFPIDGRILLSVQLLVRLNERQIGLGGDVDMSTHLLEVYSADLVNHLVDLAHVSGQLVLDFSSGVNLKV